MGTFTWWFGMTLVIIAVAVGVNEVRQDRDRLRWVAIGSVSCCSSSSPAVAVA